MSSRNDDIHYPLPSESQSKDFAENGDEKSTGFDSPDQRPTRPLDLDPFRAQVPADNIQYMRHLGFSPRNMDVAEATQDSRHGWIYLNLLVNMAQLHTINVTTEFVKKAVQEYSLKLELSTDERKIRWRGSHDVTRNSSGSSSENPSNVSPNSEAAYSENNKRLKTHHNSSSDSRKNARPTLNDKDLQKFMYTPIFFHTEASEEDDNSTTPPFVSPQSSPPIHMAGNSSGFEISGVRTSSKRRRDDGPIIFYTNAKFCTDLTGDVRDTSSSAKELSTYNKFANLPIGSTMDTETSQENLSDNFKGPLANGSGIIKDDDSMDIDNDENSTSSFPEEQNIRFSPKAVFDDESEIQKDIDFEVSGLGGVHPRDNFTINVRCQRMTIGGESKDSPAKSTIIKTRYANKLMAALHFDHRETPQVLSEIISATQKELPVSALPPASFLPHKFSLQDVDSDLESDTSEESSVGYSFDENRDPLAMPQALNISPHSEASEESSEEESDDGVLDFLATARELDPETVRAREREYDSVMAERLAEEIPAGSSAATAGGGSGFNSPSSKIGEAVEETARRVVTANNANTGGPANGTITTPMAQQHQRKSSLKRARASEGDVSTTANPDK